MKVAGIIAEYNPFHNGHEFHLKMARELSDVVVAVMSGNFVQRSEPAVMSKFSRAKAAVNCGVDLVIELPVFWSVASAKRFAFGGVSLLDSLGCVDYLCFGSECGDLNRILPVAKVLSCNEFSEHVRNNLSSSKTFATIREDAVKKILGEDAVSVLQNPNDILGVEYCAELIRINSKIEPVPVKRCGVMHDSDDVKGSFASASMIRELLRSGKDVSSYVPEESLSIIFEEIEKRAAPADIRYLERTVISKLRNMNPSDLSRVPDVSEGLENRIIDFAKKQSTLDDLYGAVKTKRYTHSRIRRIILSALLEISDIPKKVPYVRVLAFNKKGEELLKIINKTSSLPIIVNKSDIDRVDDAVKLIFDTERRASELYSLMTPAVQPFGSEFTTKVYKKRN